MAEPKLGLQRPVITQYDDFLILYPGSWLHDNKVVDLFRIRLWRDDSSTLLDKLNQTTYKIRPDDYDHQVILDVEAGYQDPETHDVEWGKYDQNGALARSDPFFIEAPKEPLKCPYCGKNIEIKE